MKPESGDKVKAAAIENGMTKVKVIVPFKSAVEYEVEVRNPHDLREVKEALQEKDPADWCDDPNFYECFGFKFRQSVRKLKRKDVWF